MPYYLCNEKLLIRGDRIKNAIYRSIYFTVQRLRGGVDHAMIEEARALLESKGDTRRARALDQLRAIHGPDFDWSTLKCHQPVDRSTLLVDAREAAERLAGRGGIEVRRTSGSTGTPFVFPKDVEMTAWMDATMWAVYSWHGVAPGVPHARFWGVPVKTRKRIKQAVSDFLLHRRRINAFDLSPTATARYYRALRRLEPEYAYGYPTLMRAFADLCAERGLDGRALGFNVVISTGEILYPALKQQLSEFFGCPVIDEYGCTESGILSFDCEHGTMHAVPVAAWPEVVDESGAPTPDGVEGEVVVSDLYGETYPLLRYRLHDRGTRSTGVCDCGRDLPELVISSGRSDSFIVTPRGPVYDAILAYTVPKGIQRFKVRQTAPDRLEASVVPGSGFVEGHTPDECRRQWQDVLGPEMTITVDTVPDLPLEPSGKLRYFVPLSDAGDRG